VRRKPQPPSFSPARAAPLLLAASIDPWLAPSACLACRPAVLPAGENAKLARVPWVGPPLCLELVHGTRVCAVRVDTAVEVETKVRGNGGTGSMAGWKAACKREGVRAGGGAGDLYCVAGGEGQEGEGGPMKPCGSGRQRGRQPNGCTPQPFCMSTGCVSPADPAAAGQVVSGVQQGHHGAQCGVSAGLPATRCRLGGGLGA
jgi:hypothetical protein